MKTICGVDFTRLLPSEIVKLVILKAASKNNLQLFTINKTLNNEIKNDQILRVYLAVLRFRNPYDALIKACKNPNVDAENIRIMLDLESNAPKVDLEAIFKAIECNRCDIVNETKV
jgi:hypothetical protein